jgi:hypothetical protein
MSRGRISMSPPVSIKPSGVEIHVENFVPNGASRYWSAYSGMLIPTAHSVLTKRLLDQTYRGFYAVLSADLLAEDCGSSMQLQIFG